MNFRTQSRLNYLVKARHRGGHGIHSPFLFHLITTVIEDQKKIPAYKNYKDLKNRAQSLLSNLSDESLNKICKEFNLRRLSLQNLYKKAELSFRYGKLVCRLINYFKPSSISNYGPSLGVNLAVIASLDDRIPVYQHTKNHEYHSLYDELLKDSALTNIYYEKEFSGPLADSEFIIINYRYHPLRCQEVVYQILSTNEKNCTLIIIGIHESKEIELIWQELIESRKISVSLDLFEIGIGIINKRLQKEDFVLRF
ncbi:MAG: hypothetical protein WCL21_03245 [Mariniphaga sp.]